MFKSLSILIAAVLFTEGLSAVVVEDRSELQILTPSLSQRTTRKLRLNNQLEVLLISDPETPYAAAALSVGVGSEQDPSLRPGLAHYTEHMLFLGNAKYPEEEGFSHFLDSYGGKRNAFTMADKTVYMFSVAHEGFDEGLDRFAHFFISPNFTPSGLQRECKAIHQEYCKNLPSDDWRMLYVKKHGCNENHPFHQFCMGNSESLCNVTHDEIKEWYESQYSANLMKLCVYANRSLDDLEKEITSLFEKIENKNIVRKENPLPLFLDQTKKHCTFVVPVQPDHCSLELSWELPSSVLQDRDRQSDRLLGYILGHEGEGTLLSQLKKAGLAHKLGSGTQKTGYGTGLFLLSIELTNQGALEYEKVLTYCFNAIHSIQNESLPQFIFDEVRKTEEINYCYQTRGDLFEFVMEHATAMQDEAIESYPARNLLPTVYDKEAFHQLVAHLSPYHANYMLLAPPELTRVVPTKKEPWMQVAYADKEIRPGLLRQWDQPAKGKELSALPSPNPFLPTALTLPNTSFEKGARFDLIGTKKSDHGILYVAKDHCFLTPTTYWQLHYKSDLVQPLKPKSGALIDLFAMIFQERCNENYYGAKLAHLDFQMTPKEDGFVLKVAGFDEKMSLLLNSLCDALKNVKLSPTEFLTFKEMLLKHYDSQLSQSPLAGAKELVHVILYDSHQTSEHKAKELLTLTLDEFDAFSNQLFQKGFIEATCYGCKEAEDAFAQWQQVQEKLAYQPFHEQDHLKRKLARFARIGRPVYLEQRFPLAAGGLILTMDFGDFSFTSRAIQQILVKAIEEPFFNELRTKQQTAYVVANWSQELERHLYNFFAIQSSSHDPRDLLARFELFLESFVMNMKEHHLSPERFALLKQALIKELTHPQYDLPNMGGLFHTLAFEYKGDFDWLQKRAKAVEDLSYEDCIQAVEKIMKENRQERIAILIKGTFENEAPFTYEQSQSIHSLKERLEYK